MDDNASEGHPGSVLMAVSIRNETATTWDVDLHEMLESSKQFVLSRSRLFTGLTREQMKSLTFKSGSFMLVKQSEVRQLKTCSFNQRYVSELNECLSCEDNRHGTFMV
jgi:hypothetical protein